MEAPKCKLCGERHYGLCNPSMTDDQWLKYRVPLTREMIEQYRAALSPDLADGLAALTETKGPTLKPKYDRNAAHRAYMKEYMRKRRAKDKGT